MWNMYKNSLWDKTATAYLQSFNNSVRIVNECYGQMCLGVIERFYFLNSDVYKNMRMMIKAFSVRISSLLLKQNNISFGLNCWFNHHNEKNNNLDISHFYIEFQTQFCLWLWWWTVFQSSNNGLGHYGRGIFNLFDSKLLFCKIF